MRRTGRGVKWKVVRRIPIPNHTSAIPPTSSNGWHALTHQDDLGVLPPSRWQPATAAGATVEAETAPPAAPATAMAAFRGAREHGKHTQVCMLSMRLRLVAGH